MKKNAVISILTCLILIVTFSSETQASSEHVAGVVTAYTGNTIGHGGSAYPNKQYDTVAVHQKSATNTDPIFVFGTTILTKDVLYLDGYGNATIFKVTDTGDVKRERPLYWFDVYFGTSTSTNIKNARNFGDKNKNVAYTAY